MLRCLHNASNSPPPSTLWLSIVAQLRLGTSALPVGCNSSAAAASAEGSTVHSAQRAKNVFRKTIQRGFSGAAAVARDVSMHMSSHETVAAHEQPSVAHVPGAISSTLGSAADDRSPAAASELRLLQAALVGAPNAGKSSLANALAGRKVAAVSHRTNTTAASRLAAFTDGAATQIALYDTPGVTSAVRSRDQNTRVQGAWQVAQHCGVVLFLVDAARQIEKPDPRVVRLAEQLAQRWAAARAAPNGHSAEVPQAAGLPQLPLDGSPESVWGAPPPSSIASSTNGSMADGGGGGGRNRGFAAALVLNKADLVEERNRLIYLNNTLSAAAGGAFEATFATSALRGGGVDELREYLFDRATPSAWLPDTLVAGETPEAHAADLAVELVKEELFRRLSGELPYELQPITTEARWLGGSGALLLKQTIFVRSESVRAIVVGTQGCVIGEIGIRARQAASKALGVSVHLYLSVVVRKDGSSETAQLMAQRGA